MTSLFVASRSREANNARWEPVGRLEYDQGIYRFSYTRGAQTLLGFSPLFGMEDLTGVYESAELFPIFKNRLLTVRGAGHGGFNKQQMAANYDVIRNFLRENKILNAL